MERTQDKNKNSKNDAGRQRPKSATRSKIVLTKIKTEELKKKRIGSYAYIL